jgi:hypothetical protein
MEEELTEAFDAMSADHDEILKEIKNVKILLHLIAEELKIDLKIES